MLSMKGMRQCWIWGGVAWGTVHAGHAGQSSLPAGLQGLCPICGANLNLEACDCHKEEEDPQNGAPAEF